MDNQGKPLAPADRDAEIMEELKQQMDDAHRRIVIELTQLLVRLRKTEQREANRRHTERILSRHGYD
ncbi:hypothetical protein [Isoalcanivorax beigongshangi]|uniref:Uncharacterized protein n=1 Tax=Isoalcanivorax beigongshangi TaxID=3238810 RepID=A0ABV4AGL2_9GAMM